MALKDIFNMVKADRYTADGREELNKAREAEVEDRTYQNGEISQKTGLMKTPNGWVKPKKGGAGNKNEFDIEARTAGRKEQKKAAAKAKREELLRQERREGEARADDFRKKVESGEIVYNKETGKFEDGPKSKPAAENKTTIRQGPNTKTLNETPAEHIKKNWDYYAEPGRYGQEDMEQLVLSPSGYKETDSYSVMGGGKRVQYEKEGGEKIALFFDKDGELDDYEIEGPGSKPAADSAPRVLTGDTKIRIRK